MALITCPDCGKQISDVAPSCPSCGRPMGTSMGISMDIATQRAIINEMYKKTVPKKKKGHGCLISILVFLGLFAFGLLVGMSTIEKKPQESSTSMVGEYIDVTEEQAMAIDASLIECGIEEIISIEYDEIASYIYAECKAYKVELKGDPSKAIVYLTEEKEVYCIEYRHYDLYRDGKTLAKVQDYRLSTDEASTLIVKCQEKIKEILKSPSTAKFASFLDWKFKKEKNIVYVYGYVDAQNGFGAEVRSEFQFIIDTDTNTITSLIFDGEELIEQ